MDLTAHLYPFGEQAGDTAVLADLLPSLKAAGFSSLEIMVDTVSAHLNLPEEVRMPIAAVHCTPAAFDDLDNLLDSLDDIGCLDLVSSGPKAWNERSSKDWISTCGLLNSVGSELEAYDIRIHYHNHEFEWQPTDNGKTAFQILRDELDPMACGLCLDCGWAQLAGQDASALIADLGTRITALHLRDFRDGTSCALGVGDVDQAPVLAATALHSRPRLIAIEMDEPADGDALTPLLDSIAHLRRLGA